MGTGIWANFHWESGIWVTGTGIWSLGMGITDRKTIELGLEFLKFGKTIGWEMGFGQNLGWENGIYTPPPPLQDPRITITIGENSSGEL